MSIPNKHFFIHPLSVLPFVIIFLLFPDPTTLVGLFSMCIHEIGHIAATKLLDYPINSIKYMICGIEIKLKYPPLLTSHKILISLGGCMANMLGMFFSCVLSFFNVFPPSVLKSLFFCNLVMCTLNILPIKGLDGGEILEVALEKILLPDTVYKISKTFSLIFTVILWVLASYILLSTSSNVSLFLVCFVLFYSNITK